MFRPPPLSLERLDVILRAIDRYGGTITKRNLDRICGVMWWEVDQAANAGFVEIEIQKPATGRPAEFVKKVSKNHPTKLPPRRSSLEKRITFKQWRFAFWYVVGESDLATFTFRRRAWKAYQKAYPRCRKPAAARASASRLMKKPEVQAAISWEFAKLERTPGLSNENPQTARDVWETLYRLGSHRFRWAPTWIQWQLSRADE